MVLRYEIKNCFGRVISSSFVLVLFYFDWLKLILEIKIMQNYIKDTEIKFTIDIIVYMTFISELAQFFELV